MPYLAEVIGTGAALCSMASFVPQILKILRERDASSVSLRMYAVTVTGFGLWIAYGAMIASWPVVRIERRLPGALGHHPGAEVAVRPGPGRLGERGGLASKFRSSLQIQHI